MSAEALVLLVLLGLTWCAIPLVAYALLAGVDRMLREDARIQRWRSEDA